MPATRNVTKRLEWDAAHRVLRHESKCATIHGHRYAAEITCAAPELDSVGRVIDFSVIKNIVGKWIDDHWDHTTICHVDDVALRALVEAEVKLGKRAPYVMPAEPTAENLAERLFFVATRLLAAYGVTVVEVVIYETPTSRATYRQEG